MIGGGWGWGGETSEERKLKSGKSGRLESKKQNTFKRETKSSPRHLRRMPSGSKSNDLYSSLPPFEVPSGDFSE